MKILFRYSVAFLGLFALLAAAAGQESRQFYKKPETTAELWRYMNHEIAVGNFKLAADYLKGFVAKTPADEELLEIQEKEGNSVFLRLLTIPEMQAEAKPLIDRLNDVLQKHLSDPGRLKKLIQNLNGDAEERAYSVAQLRRAGPLAVPALVRTLLDTANNPSEHGAVLGVLPQLDKNAMPPLHAALSVPDAVVRGELIEVFRKKPDPGAVPFLWFYSVSGAQPALVRKQATNTLAQLLGLTPGQLPLAKAALTQESEKYYQHRVSFDDPNGTKVWRWDGNQLVSQTLSASQAEEYYGLMFARQALELDPGYLPAQVVFLSVALEKGFERAGIDQPLSKGSPAVKDLLNSVNPELVITVLNRALEDRRLAVILAATRGLGDLAEVRAVKQGVGSAAPVIVRAMFYPDRRVQMAAADALLRTPNAPSPVASARAVEIFRRAIAGDSAAKVLVADMNEDRGNAVAAAVKNAGFEPVVVRTGRGALHRVTQAADIDVLLIDAGAPDPQLPYLLGQLRADVNAGLLPVLITASPNRIPALERLVERYRNVWVMPATADAEVLKRTFAMRIADSMAKPLSETERTDNTSLAMDWLLRIVRGEFPAYDVRPAQSTILQAIDNKELAARAIEAAGRIRSGESQRALARVVLDPGSPSPLRSEAAIELTRHIQENGLLLTHNEIKGFQDNLAAATDPKLKANLAALVGSTRPDPRQTGDRLQRFAPVFSMPPAAKEAPKPDEPEKKSAPGESES